MNLYERYASQEISMQELKEIEASGVVHFENQGVSRSNNRLFICVITFTSLHELITDLCAQSFPSTEALDRVISEAAALSLFMIEPLLIKRPLIVVKNHKLCGFNQRLLGKLLQLPLQSKVVENCTSNYEPCS